MDITAVRRQFPALAATARFGGRVWACAPGGTQVPQSVVEAMASFQREGLGNLHGCFGASELAEEVVRRARLRGALLVGAKSAEEVHFGANATTLTFHLARALSAQWRAGEAVVVTSLDHEANVSPWVLMAQRRGVAVRRWHFRPEDGRLHVDDLEPLLDARVRVVAVTGAANSLGSITAIERVSPMAAAVGALTVVDAVHLAPHRLVDVLQLGCDVLTCSAYKMFGPHVGVQWVRAPVAERLAADRVAPAPDRGAAALETGTPNFVSLVGFAAAVEYLCSLGGETSRAGLRNAFDGIARHEAALCERFLTGARALPSVRLYGVGEPDSSLRTATFGFTCDGLQAKEAARQLGQLGINVYSGNFYAPSVVERLGLQSQGGLVRVGYAHYNDLEDVDRTLQALSQSSRA